MTNGLFPRMRDQGAARLDRFLRARGIVQAAVVATILVGVVVAFAAALMVTGGAAEGGSTGDAAWWAIGRFSDGGTMYEDRGARLRIFGVLVTWTGVFLVQFITGFVTAKLTARLDRIASGHGPAVERDHVLVLGFDSKTPLIARELARSHQPVVLVVLADEEVHRMDTLLAAARRIPRNRLRIETRAGDPRDELSLLRVGADRARAIVIVAPDGLDDAAAMRWTFSTLLAVRRVAGTEFRGHVVVETRHLESQYLLTASADPPASEPKLEPLRLIQIAGDDIVARVLAQSIRQLGVYFVLREILSFRGCELYFEPVPDRLAGRSFDEVLGNVHGALVVGLRARGAAPVLNPDGATRLEKGDHLIVLEEDRGAFRVDEALRLPEPRLGADEVAGTEAPMSVVVLGENRALPEFLVELDGVLPTGSEVQVFVEPGTMCGDLARSAARIRITCMEREPVQVARDLGPALLGADAVVVLGMSVEHGIDADSSALEILMTLRHAERARGVRVPRVLTELLNLATASHVMATSDDFVVSSEILALLIAQLALAPDLEPVLHDDLLNPGCNDVFLRPRQVYVGEGEATFADVMAGARSRHEVAIGVLLSERMTVSPDLRSLMAGRAEDDEISPARLNPSRSELVPADARVVVIAREPTASPAKQCS
jgi:hypothetical protein